MFVRHLLVLALLAHFFTFGSAQSQVNLSIPVNHTGTGIAVGRNPDGTSFNVRLFNAKDQNCLHVGNSVQPAYWRAENTEEELIQTWMRNFQQQIILTPLYPSVVSRGGEAGLNWTEAISACYAPQRFPADHVGVNWYWSVVQPPLNPGPITCASTDRPAIGGVPFNIFVGLDRITDPDPDHYLERSQDGGITWQALPNTFGLPGNLAITDLSIEEGANPNRGVVITTSALDLVDPGELPLVTEHVITNNTCYFTQSLSNPTPGWSPYAIDQNNPPHELWNVQLTTMTGENDYTYAVALDATTQQFVTFKIWFVPPFGQFVVTPVITTINVPDGTIPYDIDYVDGMHLIASTSRGLYYSPSGVPGTEWFPATNFANDVIRTPELRRICIQPEGEGQSRIAIAGWFASYVGRVRPGDNWAFDLHEVNYNPTALQDLYQNRNHAWGAVSRFLGGGGHADVALVDHSSDEFFADNAPVTYQIQAPGHTPKSVFVAEQDDGTRPFMGLHFANGNPWIVLNGRGAENGIVVYDLLSPDFETFVQNDVDPDPFEQTWKVLEAKSSTDADYFVCSVVGSNNPTRFYYRESGTNEWQISLANFLPNHFAGTTPTTVYGAWQSIPTDNIHLIWSPDNGQTFDEMTSHDPSYPYPPDPCPNTGWDDYLALTSFSTGATDGLPMYVGGYVWQDQPQCQPLNTGQIWRFEPSERVWTHSDWENMHILFLAAHPFIPDLLWAGVKKVGSYAALLEIYVQPDGAFQWLPLWIHDDPLPLEYKVVDVQATSTGILSTDVVLTVETPDINAAGVDHTVVRRWSQWMLFAGAELPPTLSGEWTVVGDVVIPENQTLTVESGATLLFGPGAKLIVRGELLAENAVFQHKSADQSDSWNGIEVQGTARLSNCTLAGAKTCLTLMKASGEVTLSNCEIRDNEVGVYVYDNPTGAPQNIVSCSIHNNTQEGVSLLASKKLTFTGNQIQYNGHDGILAVNANFTMNENTVTRNGASSNFYGLNCSGSSPILYCNHFENNAGGEIGMSKQSYPVLWAADGSAGANSFLNDNTTLISMWDSYPIVKGGKNNFRLGTSGYFMADNSKNVPKHDISVNYWNPGIDINKLWPHDVTVWTWLPTSPENPCGSSKEGGSGAASVLYEQGFNAEMAGNTSEAQASYSSLMTQYPESTITVAAVARMFEAQRNVDSAYADLQTALLNLAAAHPEDTAFVETAQALATRLYVENQQYDPAYTTYEQIMANPPSNVDSLYAALDYTITALRQGYDSTSGGLDCAAPVVAASAITDLVHQLGSTLPTPPPTHHEGYIATPNEFYLEQNFPNPFNATTTFRYYLPQSARVKLDVFNIAGQKVVSLVDANQASGPYSVSWNGEAWASGMYIYRLDADGHVLSHKMLLLK